MAESRINLEMKLYIGRKLRFFHTQRTDAPRQGGLRPNIAIKVRIYQKVKKFEIHYGNVTDGRTDGQTDRHRNTSSGKNYSSRLPARRILLATSLIGFVSCFTSSSAVVERPRDGLCPSVVSINKIITRAESFIIIT